MGRSWEVNVENWEEIGKSMLENENSWEVEVTKIEI